MRSPAFSKRSLIAPVRLRLVASGLMIDKVRSMVIRISGSGWVIPSTQTPDNRRGNDAASRLLLPARCRLLPIGQIMPGFTGAAPAAARRLDCVRVVAVEDIGTAGKRLEILGFETVDENDHRSAV